MREYFEVILFDARLGHVLSGSYATIGTRSSLEEAEKLGSTFAALYMDVVTAPWRETPNDPDWHYELATPSRDSYVAIIVRVPESPDAEPIADAGGAELKEGEFRRDLAAVLNRHSRENGSDTPDFILAEYLARQLAQFDAVMHARKVWGAPRPAEPAPPPAAATTVCADCGGPSNGFVVCSVCYVRKHEKRAPGGDRGKGGGE